MTERTSPKISKWPFLIGDLLLVAVAFWLGLHSPEPFARLPLIFTVLCVALGAWICVLPFIMEYRAQTRLAENSALADTLAQIQELKSLAVQINTATVQWTGIQDQGAQTLKTAREITETMNREAREFQEFMAKANNSEKAHMRLELEKLRRGEADWLQVAVRILDHVFALYNAGVRSGQANLIEQLGNFQRACRDTTRRIGLVPFEPAPNDPFKPEIHQVPEDQGPVTGDAVIAGLIAPGYSFQGQLLRGALVSVKPAANAPATENSPEPANPEPPAEGGA